MTTKSKKSGIAWVRAASMSPRTWVWLTAALAACGLKLNLNGQTHTIGGGGDAAAPATASAGPAASSSAARSHKRGAAGADDDAPQAPASYQAQTLVVKDALTSTPQIADISGVALDGRFSKILHVDSPECGQTVSSHPIASIDVQTPDAGMEIAVVGGHDDGFVVKHGDQVWSTCAMMMSQVPMMSAPKGGWQPGHYDIYPVTRFAASASEGYRFEVAVSNPAHLAPWSGDVRAIKLDGKLATPMIVDVPLHANRHVLAGAFSGDRCDKVALAFEPDISVRVARPIPGLTIRPLPSRSPVTIRLEQRTDDKRTQYFCQRGERTSGGNGPSWHAESEIHFGNQEEGVWGMSFGTAPDDKDDKVTLMIYDDSTKFDDTVLRPLPGDGPLDLEHRELPWHFPQLADKDLDMQTRAHAELAAKLFATAPAGLFVYPDLDLDKELAQPEGPAGDASFPNKNEPLLLVSGGERAIVLAQDGLEYQVKSSHLVLAPADGGAALLAAPRPLRANLDIYALEAFNSDDKAVAQLDAFEKKYSTCVDQVAEPYERQIPRVVASDGTSIELENSHTRGIRDAEDTAIIHACGSRDAHDKGRDKFRAKFAAAADKTRAALFAAAKPKL
jgi:hypothetical protein|nr:hypothetical protein [Kofleriaceae bacterium]